MIVAGLPLLLDLTVRRSPSLDVTKQEGEAKKRGDLATATTASASRNLRGASASERIYPISVRAPVGGSGRQIFFVGVQLDVTFACKTTRSMELGSQEQQDRRLCLSLSRTRVSRMYRVSLEVLLPLLHL